MSVDDDADAISASLADPSAFEAVFDRHFAAVHRFVRRRVGLALADDVAAERRAGSRFARHSSSNRSP